MWHPLELWPRFLGAPWPLHESAPPVTICCQQCAWQASWLTVALRVLMPNLTAAMLTAAKERVSLWGSVTPLKQNNYQFAYMSTYCVYRLIYLNTFWCEIIQWFTRKTKILCYWFCVVKKHIFIPRFMRFILLHHCPRHTFSTGGFRSGSRLNTNLIEF